MDPSISEPTTNKIDFIAIKNNLETALNARGMLNTNGLCPERFELYKQTFDQIVLQLSAENADQARILASIRDEFTMTTDAYKKLYESSVSFGLNKAIDAKHNNEKLHERIEELMREKQQLWDENEHIKRKLAHIQRDEEKKREREMARYRLELRILKDRNEQIKLGLERCLIKGQDDVSSLIQSDHQ
jgi:dynein light intermediate chain, axonemal